MAAEWVIGAAALCLFSGGGCFNSFQNECYEPQQACSVNYACQPQGYGWQGQAYAAPCRTWEGYGAGYQAQYQPGPHYSGVRQSHYTATYGAEYQGYRQYDGWNQYDDNSRSRNQRGYGKSYRSEMSGGAQYQGHKVQAEVEY